MKPERPGTPGQTKQAIPVNGERNMFTVTQTYERGVHCFQTDLPAWTVDLRYNFRSMRIPVFFGGNQENSLILLTHMTTRVVICTEPCG